MFALGIMPYISQIFMQIAAAVVTTSRDDKDEEVRRDQQWTRYLTVLLAAGQAYTFAMFTRGAGPGGEPGVGSPREILVPRPRVFVSGRRANHGARLGNGASLMIFF